MRRVFVVVLKGSVPGSARLLLAEGVPLLRPEEQIFGAMLDGWRNQQLARNLATTTIEDRARKVNAFLRFSNAFPWQWTPQLVDEWSGDLRAIRHVSHSTLRGYQHAIKSFCDYVTDPAYGWASECEMRFGTHPIQVDHEWNTAVHVADSEARPRKRAFTRDELQAFFDHADDEVTRKRRDGRKGWLAAFRDATIFKTAYGFGTRRNETRMLDAVDFGRNPSGPEFGDYGVCFVRYGKAQKGSPPKRRSVLTVWEWTADVLEEWFTDVWPYFGADDNPAAWPSERGLRVGPPQINRRFGQYRDELGLDELLDFHSLRRPYVTHLIEDGYDARFVQEQVGHQHASTTSIYTCVSSDYRTRTLRRALDATISAALGPATTGRGNR
ncbi:tyrosine-type recombinase/integrase [Sphaerisporangium sp. NPDC049003]|uniref:tyrosine-type recombinase/integrase n=1 Tax=Sphaerisporangium sp. NPDC049003 TaxID=3364517 RepID=UPI003724A051